MLKNPLNKNRAITLTLDQFKYGWANALDDAETKQLYETYHVAAPGMALMQMANANLNPFTEAKLDPKNPGALVRCWSSTARSTTRSRGRSRTPLTSARSTMTRSPRS